MSHRFGPTRLGPPLPTVWQALHFLNIFSPASALAKAKRVPRSAGSAGAATTALGVMGGAAAPGTAARGSSKLTSALPIMLLPHTIQAVTRTAAPNFSRNENLMGGYLLLPSGPSRGGECSVQGPQVQSPLRMRGQACVIALLRK